MVTPINNRALVKLLYTFGGLGSLVAGWVSWVSYGRSQSFLYYTSVSSLGVVHQSLMWLSWVSFSVSHFLLDSISFYTKQNYHATAQMSNKSLLDMEFLRLAGHASLVLWVLIFTLRVSELKIHGLKIRIRGAVVQKSADLPRWTPDITNHNFFSTHYRIP